MKAIHYRVVIYPKDVEILTGQKLRSARKLLHKIRQVLGKQSHEFVTIKEFAAFTGISEDQLKEYLRN